MRAAIVFDGYDKTGSIRIIEYKQEGVNPFYTRPSREARGRVQIILHEARLSKGQRLFKGQGLVLLENTQAEDETRQLRQ